MQEFWYAFIISYESYIYCLSEGNKKDFMLNKICYHLCWQFPFVSYIPQCYIKIEVFLFSQVPNILALFFVSPRGSCVIVERELEVVGDNAPENIPVVDVTGDGSKVRCCKEQYCIGTQNVRSINQDKLKVVKQKMARVNFDILAISELKWTGMGEFN